MAFGGTAMEIAMATAAPAIPAVSDAPARRVTRPRFYLYLSLACLTIAVLGFVPTYWMQLPLGTFTGTPLLHVHGLLFTAWLLLLVGQNWRISQGRLDHHRAWGLAGVALATMIFMIGVTTAIVGLGERYAAGMAEAGRTFLVVPLFSILVFYGFFIAAIANLRRPEWHRRFIFVATAAMLVPAIARVFFIARNGWAPGIRPGAVPPAPIGASLYAIVAANAVIVAGMVYDWRSRRRVHPAWLYGIAVFLGGAMLRGPLAGTQAWQSFADWTTRLV
jgi:hypothetical protein